MGDTLDKREATDPWGNQSSVRESSESREAEQREMLGQGIVKDIGLPMLPEARN